MGILWPERLMEQAHGQLLIGDLRFHLRSGLQVTGLTRTGPTLTGPDMYRPHTSTGVR